MPGDCQVVRKQMVECRTNFTPRSSDSVQSCRRPALRDPTAIADQLVMGSGVWIHGVVEEYPRGSGQRQVRLERLAPVEIMDFEDLLPVAKRDLAEMRHLGYRL